MRCLCSHNQNHVINEFFAKVYRKKISSKRVILDIMAINYHFAVYATTYLVLLGNICMLFYSLRWSGAKFCHIFRFLKNRKMGSI